MTDEQAEAAIYDFAIKHFRSATKSVLIGLMIFSSVAVFSGSTWKATVIGLSCIVFSLFNTWRRFLETIAFVLFCAGMVYWCVPDLWSGLKVATAVAR